MQTFGGKSPLRQMSKLGKANPKKMLELSGQRNNSSGGKNGLDSSRSVPGGGAGLRKLNSNFTTKFISEAGTKLKNKDYFGFVELDNFACWAVAKSYDNDDDIMSAQMVVDTVLDMFTRKPTLSKRKLKSYIREAHNQLKHQSGKFQLKATIMIIASDYKKIRYAHCGNCRLNIFRGNNILERSHDQSLYQDMIVEGDIPDNSEIGIEESQNLFNFLGKQGGIKIDVSKKIVLDDEDILLLTTWGFWEKITTIEMLDALEDAKEPLDYLDELQELFLSKQEKTVNNYTMSAIFVHKTFVEKNNTAKIIKLVLLITIPIIIIGIILFTYFYQANIKRLELKTNITEFQSQGDIYVGDNNYDRALAEYDKGIEKSKELKGVTGKKGVENKEIKDLLAIKQRTSSLIIDGDQLFSTAKYKEAKSSYSKSLVELKKNNDFQSIIDTKYIEDKILLCDNYEFTDKLIALAINQSDLGQFDKALLNYEEARKLAISSNNTDAEKTIKLNTEEVNSKIKSLDDAKTDEEKQTEQEELDKKVKEVEINEIEADKAVIDENYDNAMEIYKSVSSKYIELNLTDKAASTELKIADVKDKIRIKNEDDQLTIAEGYILTGDNYLSENNFEEAVNNYKLARDIYIVIKKPDEIVKANDKISVANIKTTELKVANKTLEIQMIENEGDEFLKLKDYPAAREKYRQAQTLYKGNNEMDKVLLVEDKIKTLETIQNENEIEDKKEKEKREEEEKAKIIYGAQTMELYAEQEVEKLNFEMAIIYYEGAKNIYQSVEEYDKALELQGKILELQKWIY